MSRLLSLNILPADSLSFSLDIHLSICESTSSTSLFLINHYIGSSSIAEMSSIWLEWHNQNLPRAIIHRLSSYIVAIVHHLVSTDRYKTNEASEATFRKELLEIWQLTYSSIEIMWPNDNEQARQERKVSLFSAVLKCIVIHARELKGIPLSEQSPRRSGFEQSLGSRFDAAMDHIPELHFMPIFQSRVRAWTMDWATRLEGIGGSTAVLSSRDHFIRFALGPARLIAEPTVPPKGTGEVCTICEKEYGWHGEPRVRVRCGHTFGMNCILRLIFEHLSWCPKCGKDMLPLPATRPAGFYPVYRTYEGTWRGELWGMWDSLKMN